MADNPGGMRQKDRFNKLIIGGEVGGGQTTHAAEARPSKGKASASAGERIAFHRFEGSETISGLFEFNIEALSHEIDLKLAEMLGQTMCVEHESYGGVVRHFNGILTEAERVGAKEEKYLYRFILRPWLWLLGRRQNSKIFKGKTIPDIIEMVFKAAGFDGSSYYKVELTHAFKPAEYIVQYQETDLAFVCRLMEEWGIYFYFEHSATGHVLHLVDSEAMHPKITVAPPGAATSVGVSQEMAQRQAIPSASDLGAGSLLFRPLTGRDRRPQEHVTTWLAERRVRSGRVELRDYDYTVRPKKMKGEDDTSETYRHGKIEVYDYRGRWADKDDEGDYLAKVRLEAEQAVDHHKWADGDAASLYPGGHISLVGHPTENEDYLVVAATHSFASQEYRSGSAGVATPYIGHYEFYPQSRPFRAPHLTPKARIVGPQTAFVTTREGVAKTEEIDVDKYGRIAVNFHWNRGDASKDCSRDVRVAQLWAGKGWGAQFIPRVGMEVVVEFLDGDPDQPLVTGCVYNSDFPYPYTMPDHKTQSGLKTDSSIDSGNNAYNELRFEDKKGQEEVYFRAEKDHNTLIQNIETRKVLNHQMTTIGENFDGNKRSKHDGLSRLTDIENGSDHLYINNGDKFVTLKSGDVVNLVQTGGHRTTLEQGDYGVDVTGELKITVSSSITIEIKGGQTSIKMDPSGITLKGPMININ